MLPEKTIKQDIENQTNENTDENVNSRIKYLLKYCLCCNIDNRIENPDENLDENVIRCMKCQIYGIFCILGLGMIGALFMIILIVLTHKGNNT